MPTTTDIVKQVRALEIKSKRLARNLFSGEYHSTFKGRGMSFKEVREYAAGDDVRFIDWNVSARFGHPYSKLFEEERELTVMLLIDISGSTDTGTRQHTKRSIAVEMASILAFSAIENGDKIGAVFFSDKIEMYVAPQKGRQHALYLIREALTLQPQQSGTSIIKALRYFNNAMRRDSIAFVLSDFRATGYEEALRVAAKKHDIIGIQLKDEMDHKLPPAGLLPLADAETGAVQWVDSGSTFVRKKYKEAADAQDAYTAGIFKKAGCDLLQVYTHIDHVRILEKFFKSRIR